MTGEELAAAILALPDEQRKRTVYIIDDTWGARSPQAVRLRTRGTDLDGAQLPADGIVLECEDPPRPFRWSALLTGAIAVAAAALLALAMLRVFPR